MVVCSSRRATSLYARRAWHTRLARALHARIHVAACRSAGVPAIVLRPPGSSRHRVLLHSSMNKAGRGPAAG